MCIGCGGTCGGTTGAPPAPRFATPPGDPAAMTVVGTAAGPDTIPTGLVRATGQLLTYESLYAGLAPNGQPAAMVAPGTYGQHATRAGRR